MYLNRRRFLLGTAATFALAGCGRFVNLGTPQTEVPKKDKEAIAHNAQLLALAANDVEARRAPIFTQYRGILQGVISTSLRTEPLGDMTTQLYQQYMAEILRRDPYQGAGELVNQTEIAVEYGDRCSRVFQASAYGVDYPVTVLGQKFQVHSEAQNPGKVDRSKTRTCNLVVSPGFAEYKSFDDTVEPAIGSIGYYSSFFALAIAAMMKSGRLDPSTVVNANIIHLIPPYQHLDPQGKPGSGSVGILDAAILAHLPLNLTDGNRNFFDGKSTLTFGSSAGASTVIADRVLNHRSPNDYTFVLGGYLGGALPRAVELAEADGFLAHQKRMNGDIFPGEMGAVGLLHGSVLQNTYGFFGAGTDINGNVVVDDSVLVPALMEPWIDASVQRGMHTALLQDVQHGDVARMALYFMVNDIFTNNMSSYSQAFLA